MKSFCFVNFFYALLFLVFLNPSNSILKTPKIIDVDLQVLKDRLILSLTKGEFHDILNELNGLERKYGNLAIDNRVPSFFNIKGVALHGLFDHKLAVVAFRDAVKFYPNETRAWINLGDTYQVLLEIPDAIKSFEKAWEIGDLSAASRLLAAKGWSNSWRGFEEMAAKVEYYARLCGINKDHCVLDSTLGLDYIDCSGDIMRYIHTKIPNAQDSEFKISLPKPSHHKYSNLKSIRGNNRLKVGIISSDFGGVHPVSSLIRGVIEFIDKSIIELFCFSLTSQGSWWGENMSDLAEHYILLDSMDTVDGAKKIAARKIDILIDLNGLTKNSGIVFMSHRPAPVQISYLGLPTTTGAPYMDYYIGDYIALPPEHRDHFVENLALMHPCYIANDYSQMHSDIVKEDYKYRRAHKSLLESSDIDITNVTMLFATLSNSQKYDPMLFQVWTNVLRSLSGSKMAIMDYATTKYAIANLRDNAQALGIAYDRIVNIPQANWIDHIYRKTAVDMFLDTTSKNGHTTGLDGIWAGVPTIALAGGATMPKRAAESIATALGSEIGLTYSLKEYEDMILQYSQLQNSKRTLSKGSIKKICDGILGDGLDDEAIEYCFEVASLERERLSGKEKLEIWRTHVEEQRTKSSLFDTKAFTKQFTHLLQAIWELHHLSISSSTITNFKKPGFKKYHVFPTLLPKSVFTSINISAIIEKDVSSRNHISPSSYFKGRSNNKSPTSGGSSTDIKGIKKKVIKVGNIRPKIKAIDPSEYSPLPDDLFDGRLIMLNIGGIRGREGWINVNAQMSNLGKTGSATADTIIRNMFDLKGIPNNSVSAIYSSHTLEHSSIGDGTLTATLREWRRVLRPNGILFVALPDLETIFRMYLDKSMDLQDKWMATMMIYGAQSDEYDFHMVGFDEEILTSFLQQEGFCKVERVGSYRLFDDTSDINYKGYKVSLNLVAKKCIDNHSQFDNFDISHSALPYNPRESL